MTFAAAGLFVARAVISFSMVYKAHMDAYRSIQRETKMVPAGSPAFDQTTFATISILGQQNQAMTGFILGTMDSLLKEFVFSSEKKDSCFGTSSSRRAQCCGAHGPHASPKTWGDDWSSSTIDDKDRPTDTD